ncbi:MAG TPA: beta-galactosidase, partial [Roseiflexaceae bacterium]|nr:beta-galactosidase [Roseiflexaceae bacterium]
YLAYVRRLYSAIGRQLRGQFYQDGGPIVAVQLENEFMHASAPWEVVPRQSRHWVGGGTGGVAHMAALKQIAQECELVAPFYTSTGWGGAPVLEGEILPLYGGYAFCPWNVDAQRPHHAPTAEYLFRSFHENGASWGEAEPPYPPESYPFACCEMGGGMQVWYQYRFVVPSVSVEAMALHKIAGGCNFVGYYMYHGGSNPVGQRGYLNEHVTPKISYDFQAPLGEFGQAREAYRALRLLHIFLIDFATLLCPMATVLPPSNAAITPEDTSTLRFAARTCGDSGFLFLNNYQDHVEMRDQEDVRIALQLDGSTLTLPRAGMTLRRDVCAILPFNFEMNGAQLVYATTQLITRIEHAGEVVYFFFAPEGLAAEYCFARAGIARLTADRGTLDEQGERVYVAVEPGRRAIIRLRTVAGNRVAICTLTRQEALQFTKFELWGRERVVLSDAELAPRNGLLDLVGDAPDMRLSVFPDIEGALFGAHGRLERVKHGLFAEYSVCVPPKTIELDVEQISPARATIDLPADAFRGVDDILLEIDYRGDVGYASIAGQLIGDNFANGTTWQLGLRRHEPEALAHGIDLYITPLRAGQVAASDSPMAAQPPQADQEVAEILSIAAVPRYRAWVAQRPTPKGGAAD